MRGSRCWLLGLVMLGFACTAQACSCIGRPACGAIKLHDAMFVGKVLRVRAETASVKFGDGEIEVRRQIYTFAVVEAFSGTEQPGEEVDVWTGFGGGDCGYGFVMGDRYFVDAFQNQGKLSTGICSATAPETEAALTLRELRAAARGARSPDLSGILVRRDPGSGWAQSEPLAGIDVTAKDENGAEYHATTETDGTYQVLVLPSGKYTITFHLPSRLMLGSYDQKHNEITIPAGTGTGAGCHASANAYPAGRIPGQVVDARGNGVAGFVAVYPVPPTGKQPFSWSAASPVEKDGRFDLAPLAAGTYWLEYHHDNDFKTATYFPGTLDKAGAQPITVEEGEATAPIRLVVTP